MWFAFFLILFLSIVDLIQYQFVSKQTTKATEKKLQETASQIEDSLKDISGNLNVVNYRHTYTETPYDFIVSKSGFIIDAVDDFQIGLIKNVSIPYQGIFNNPQTIKSEFGENWRLYAKKIDKGILVLGVNNPQNASIIDQALLDTSAKFGDNLSSALRLDNRQVPNDIDYAVIDENYTLRRSSGGIPLKTSENYIAASDIVKTDKYNGKFYLVIYHPVYDSKRNLLATIILPQDVNVEKAALKNLLQVNAVVAVVSLLIFFIYGYFNWNKSEAEKRKIKENFKYYFSPQIMEILLKNPQALRLGGQKTKATVLFSDIEGFTTISEKLKPKELTQFLNEYFTEMTQEIFATDGVVDKFIGDSIMAFWGAPIEQSDQADRAVGTAVKMIVKLDELNKKWMKEGKPKIRIRIGINTGIVTAGNMGSDKRYEYTLVGDNVNIASRLEQLNKDYKSQIIISENTKRELHQKINFKNLGHVKIRGKVKQIKIYQIT